MPDLAQLRTIQIPHTQIITVERDAAMNIVREKQTYTHVAPRTKLRLRIQPATGSNINVELWLPDAENWNTCFLGLGNGGAAGSINADRFIDPLCNGYAVACTDMGTAPDSDSGIGNPEVWKDFGYRATHLMTMVSKQIIAAFYKKSLNHAYFIGASTGGQQALQEAQRYPEDYDGIVAMVPAHCRTPLHAYFLWNEHILATCPFSEEQEQNVIAAANEYMSSRQIPLFAGKLVADPRCSSDDINAVIKLAAEKDNSLSKQHQDALRKLFTGPREDHTGAHIFDGVPLGSSFRSAVNNTYVFQWAFHKDVDLYTLNFSTDMDSYTQKLAAYLNAENPDMSAFFKRGGKLIMTSGSADPIVPYHATLDYYERITEQFPSLEECQEHCRYFLIPGRDHGIGGPGINKEPHMLELIATWREQDQAPASLQCQRWEDGKLIYEIPVYPYPAISTQHESGTFVQTQGTRGEVGRVDQRFLRVQ